jgi:transposase
LDTDPTFGVFFMTKHSEHLKLKLVRQYESGAGGMRTIAQRSGVSYTVLRRWIAAYEEHGRDGLRKKYSHYDAQFRLCVLSHMWRENLSYRQTAAVFDIRAHEAIGQWERQYHAGGVDALAPRPRGRRPKTMTRPDHDKPTEGSAPDERTREQLLKENEYLRAEVAYLKKLDALLQAKKQAAQKKKRR